MDINDLRNVRNKSVQQQNELSYMEMEEQANDFIKNPSSYPWLITLLGKYELQANDGLLVSCGDVPEQLGLQWLGIWLTRKEEFYEFDVMADYESGELIEIDGWAQFHPEINAHCKGTGKSFGYLALELMKSHEKS